MRLESSARWQLPSWRICCCCACGPSRLSRGPRGAPSPSSNVLLGRRAPGSSNGRRPQGRARRSNCDSLQKSPNCGLLRESITHPVNFELVANEPKRGQQGHEVQSNVTDNESAKMFTAHGVLQGYNSQALVDAKHQVIVHAAAFGNGQDYGHVPPMVEGAKAHVQAIGLGEDYFAGKI